MPPTTRCAMVRNTKEITYLSKKKTGSNSSLEFLECVEDKTFSIYDIAANDISHGLWASHGVFTGENLPEIRNLSDPKFWVSDMTVAFRGRWGTCILPIIKFGFNELRLLGATP